MNAPFTSRTRAPWNLNHLRRGSSYRATTRDATTFGEYLGMETPHGDLSILIRSRAGTASIAVGDITSLEPATA